MIIIIRKQSVRLEVSSTLIDSEWSAVVSTCFRKRIGVSLWSCDGKSDGWTRWKADRCSCKRWSSHQITVSNEHLWNTWQLWWKSLQILWSVVQSVVLVADYSFSQMMTPSIQNNFAVVSKPSGLLISCSPNRVIHQRSMDPCPHNISHHTLLCRDLFLRYNQSEVNLQLLSQTYRNLWFHEIKQNGGFQTSL